MNIITRGKKPDPEWVGRYTCDLCGTVADIEASDKDLIRDWNTTHEGGFWVAVRCEVCEDWTRWVRQPVQCTCEAPPVAGHCTCGRPPFRAPETDRHGAVIPSCPWACDGGTCGCAAVPREN